MAKHKFGSISLTVRDRAISSKFSTHRVSKECTLCNFQKIFPSPKMAAILNFRILAKHGKTQICFYSNSNSTFIALNLRQKTDSKAHHTKTLFNIQKPETLQGSAPRRKQKGDWKFRVGMLFQRGMTSTLT